MAAKKTIIVGSLYEFSELASNELIQTNKDAHDNPDMVPFFYFDSTKQAFCAEIDQHDSRTMRDFLARMAGYIEFQHSARPTLDDEPRIRPMQGTLIDDLIPEDVIEGPPLLKYDSDSGSSDGEALEPMQHLTTYWKPRNGRISILPPMYAKEITQSTGSSLFAEEAEKRYRIFQGNFKLALEKLVRLEPLLETFEKQSGNSSLQAAGNLLVWPPNQQEARLEYVNVVLGHSSYSRVIVNRQEQTLSRKVLGELRSLDSRTRALEVPQNLQYVGFVATAEVQASKIWSTNAHQYNSFGNPLNMEPIVTSNPSSVDNGDVAPVKDLTDDKILSWTNNVELSANPEIAPEAPTEPVAPSRRKLIVDSDSEDEELPVRLNKKSMPPVIQAAKPDPYVQLSSFDDLRSAKQPARESESLQSPLPRANNDMLIEITDDDSIIAKSTSARTPQPLWSVVEDGAQPGTVARSPNIIATRQEISNLSTDMLDRQADGLPPVPSKTPLYNQASTVDQVTESTPLRQSSAFCAEVLPTVPEEPPPQPLRPALNPDAYRSPQNARGRAGRGGRGGRGAPQSQGLRGQASNRSRGGNRREKSQNNNRAKDSRPESTPTPTHVRNDLRGAHTAHSVNPPARGPPQNRDTWATAPPNNPRNLVDLRESTTTNGAPTVPPGFESIMPLVPENISRAPVVPPGFEATVPSVPMPTSYHEAAEPQSPGTNALPDPAPAQSRMQSNATSGSSTSGRSRTSRWRFRDEGSTYVTTFIPKVDQAAIREKTLQDLAAAVAAHESRNKKVDEEAPPTMHSTMRQQSKNPGKKSAKSSSSKETAAEAAARRQQVLAEAYGPSPVATPPRSRPSLPKAEDMSKWKREQLKKQTPMAQAHPEIVGDSLRGKEASRLVSLLQPVFEVGRALKGNLFFEIQIGQVLVAPGQQMHEKTFHSIEDWNSYFDSRGSSHTFSTFTKILTSNGADVDRALETKGLGRDGSVKLWDPTPSSQSVHYEFQCQGRSNEDFQIVVHETGAYELRKGQIIVGTINIHVPAQIWDLSATLSAPFTWSDPPETVAQSANTFCESLYVVPKRKKLMLYFRPPNDREIKIRNLIVKRISYHPSNRADGKDIFLKVIEAKNLQFRVHSEDQTLWMAYEPSLREKGEYQSQLADAGRIHYELSVVHDGINGVLVKNESLQIGELTDSDSTGKALLDRAVIRSMLDAAMQLVSKIDYIGMWNYGTQKRREEEEVDRKAKLLAELGPRARTLHAPGTSIVRGSVVGGNGMHTVTGHTVTAFTTVQQPVPGLRMDTIAEIKVDEFGNRYFYGMGGAKVPLSTGGEELLNSGATVVPDDSASQAGRGPQFAAARPGERGQGFW